MALEDVGRRAAAPSDGLLAEQLVTIQTVESSLGQLAPRQVDALVEHDGFDMDSFCRSYLDLLDGVQMLSERSAGR